MKSLFKKIKLFPHKVLNVDETGVTTIHNLKHVIAKKGERQISAVTSSEQVAQVTKCNTENPGGISVLPF